MKLVDKKIIKKALKSAKIIESEKEPFPSITSLKKENSELNSEEKEVKKMFVKKKVKISKKEWVNLKK